MTDAIKKAAITYASFGWPVVACHSIIKGKCTCKKKSCRGPGKHPRLDLCPHGVKDATTDIKVIGAWPDGINIGVALGKVSGGLMACDVDNSQMARDLLAADLGLSDETSISTTNKGMHLWFKTTGDTTTFIMKVDGSHIGEVRGDGAYVIAPPSLTPRGRTYSWVGRPESASDLLSMTASPREYARLLFQRIGVTLDGNEEDDGTQKIDAPKGFKVKEITLPEELRTDNRMLEYVIRFSGSVGKEPRGVERSGKLFKFACEVARVSKDRDYDLTAKELASLIYSLDIAMFSDPKFANRQNPTKLCFSGATRAMRRVGADLNTGGTAGGRTGNSQAANYVWDETDGWLYWTGSGGRRAICNFDARIIAEGILDTGEGGEDLGRMYDLEVKHGNGEIQKVFLTDDDRATARSMEVAFSRKLPSIYTVEPSMYGRLKTALSVRSTPKIARYYCSTGWVDHEGGKVYLLPSALGGIGPDGLDSSVSIPVDKLRALRRGVRDQITVALPDLSGYGRGVRPPASDTDKSRAIDAFRKAAQLTPPEVAVPLLLQIMGGPLVSAGAQFSPPVVHLIGQTGSYKSSYAALLLSLFGDFDKKAPYSFDTTPASGRILMHYLRDVTFLIDDWKKGTVVSDKKAHDWIGLLQNYADRTSTGRATPSQSVVPGTPARCLLLTTGEDKWEKVQSTEARTVLVSLKHGDVDLGGLTEAQKAGSVKHGGLLQQFGGLYIRWLARNPSILTGGFERTMEKMLVKVRKQVTAGRIHSRVSASLATLLTIGWVTREFARDEGIDWWPDVLGEGVDSMIKNVRIEGVDEASAWNQTRDRIVNGIAARRVKFLPVQPETLEIRPYPDIRGGETVGYWYEENGETWVLLTERSTYGWLETSTRKEGGEVPYSWHHLRREIVENWQGRTKRNVRVWRKRGAPAPQQPQFSGVALPLSIILGQSEDGIGNR